MSKYAETQITHLRRYFARDFRREANTFKWMIWYYGFFLSTLLILAIVVVIQVRPLPPLHTYLATGQQDSSYQTLAQDFQAAFAGHGLKLELITTKGLQVGLQDLNSDLSQVNASFVVAGAGNATDFEHLVSLGSVQVSPIWLFYRGKETRVDDPFAYFSKQRFAVGQTGTVTNQLFHKLREISHPGAEKVELDLSFRQYAHAEAADKLIKGSLDAMLIVDSFESKTVQKLLLQPDIQIYNFALADAYIKKLPMLEKVVVPRGSIDIATIRPNRDITLLASNINLLVESKVHPAVQWAFIKAARDLNSSRSTFFHRPGHFPIYLDKTFPLSETAKRYYTSGVPAVFGHLPLWAATLVDTLWIAVLTLIVVVLPLAIKIFGLRSFNSKKVIADLFKSLRDLEEDIREARTATAARQALDKVLIVESQMKDTWMEVRDVRFFFIIKKVIEDIKKSALVRLSLLEVHGNSGATPSQ
jgi:TRAP-type uncharacterized transport system substrate-binding protein